MSDCFSVNQNHFGVSNEFRWRTLRNGSFHQKTKDLLLNLCSQLITKGVSRHRHSFEIDERVHFNFRLLYRAISCDELNESKRMVFLLKFKSLTLFTKQLSHTILFSFSQNLIFLHSFINFQQNLASHFCLLKYFKLSQRKPSYLFYLNLKNTLNSFCCT